MADNGKMFSLWRPNYVVKLYSLVLVEFAGLLPDETSLDHAVCRAHRDAVGTDPGMS